MVLILYVWNDMFIYYQVLIKRQMTVHFLKKVIDKFVQEFKL